MTRKRLLVVVPALTVVAWMAVQVFGLAIAGSVMHDASQAMDLWSGAKPPTPESLANLRNDLQRSPMALRLALRDQAQMRELGARKQRRRCIRTRGDARPAADARGGIHGRLRGHITGVMLTSWAPPVATET